MSFTTRDNLNTNSQHGLKAVFLVWFGILLGVSFLSTPVKFQAPHLTLAVALEVGKVTFHLLHKVEWGMFALTLFLAYLAQVNKKIAKNMFVLLTILIVQNLWIMPTLDLRTDSIIAGGAPSPGHFHLIYIMTEAFKLILLGFIAFLLTWNAPRNNEKRKIFNKKL